MLLGSDLENMSDQELAKAAETTDVFAKLTPDQKARVVSVFRGKWPYSRLYGRWY